MIAFRVVYECLFRIIVIDRFTLQTDYYIVLQTFSSGAWLGLKKLYGNTTKKKALTTLSRFQYILNSAS